MCCCNCCCHCHINWNVPWTNINVNVAVPNWPTYYIPNNTGPAPANVVISWNIG